MVDMASKNISTCTVSYTALSMETDLHFQFNSCLFPHKLFKILFHLHTFFSKCASR